MYNVYKDERFLSALSFARNNCADFGLLQCCMHNWPWKIAAIPRIKFVSKLSCSVSLKRGHFQSTFDEVIVIGIEW
ncbi:hypothetical protein T4D_5940 [Trichinella pseudospiralis]|uniref:Uncharacterized protein n=1 Tax=Trichinella pseudospiralis TaxID=6337 RepID=A0A0V1FIN1_TRIPS|nr:hypothetical protein T4D_5940 [Trichinella pseudospiralis]